MMPEVAMMPGVGAALEELADACQEWLAPGVFTRVWAAASSERLEAISPGVTDAREQKRRQIAHLYERGQIFTFNTAIVELDPPPDKRVREAVRALQRATAVDLTRWSNLGAAEQQAVLVDRDAYMSEADIDGFCQQPWPRMCCVAGATTRLESGNMVDREIGGTAFLVGPDLIMTNSHVIEPLLDAATGVARPDTHKDFCVFFDHHRSQQIVVHTVDYPGTLKAYPHAEWLVTRSPGFCGGGDIDKYLDYALIRLTDNVGLSARNQRVGPTRGWISLPAAGAPDNLRPDTRLAIPQHPAGNMLVLDIGRMVGGLGSTRSRIRYAVNTSPGSSGSPVLASGGRLVALHEGRKPRGEGGRNSNQGIRVTAFNGSLGALLPVSSSPEFALTEHWSVGGGNRELKPLIGRRDFIGWITASRQAKTAEERMRAPPICVIQGHEKSGRSFSADILATVLENTQDHLLTFRSLEYNSADRVGDAYRLPERPDKLMLVLANELGISGDTIPPAPPELDRKETLLGEALVADRKPNAWASEDLPNWLRTQLVSKFIAQPEARVWVVFDIAPGAPFGPFMRDFVCAWTASVEVSHPFAQCRWIFIGYDPDFIKLGERRLEVLNPVVDLRPEDLLRFITAAYAAVGSKTPVEMKTAMQWVLYRPDRNAGDGARFFWEWITGMCSALLNDIRRKGELS
jgi:hypothetical protein